MTRFVVGSGIIGIDILHNIAVSGFVFREISPSVKFGFIFSFRSRCLKFRESINHTLAVFPVIGNARVFGGVVQANTSIFVHVYFHSVHCCFRSFYPCWIGILDILIDASCRQPTVGTARITHDHGKIAFLDTF